MKASTIITRPTCSRPIAEIAVSMSASLRTCMLTGSIVSQRAAASNEPRNTLPPLGAVSGLNMIPARLIPGAI